MTHARSVRKGATPLTHQISRCSPAAAQEPTHEHDGDRDSLQLVRKVVGDRNAGPARHTSLASPADLGLVVQRLTRAPPWAFYGLAASKRGSRVTGKSRHWWSIASMIHRSPDQERVKR